MSVYLLFPRLGGSGFFSLTVISQLTIASLPGLDTAAAQLGISNVRLV